METNGKVIKVLPEQTFQSGRTKYSFVVETGGQYPQQLPFEVWGEEKWRQMNVREGVGVSVSFDINGREYNGKYFVSLSAWKVVCTDAVQAATTENRAPNPVTQRQKEAQEDTLLPF